MKLEGHWVLGVWVYMVWGGNGILKVQHGR